MRLVGLLGVMLVPAFWLAYHRSQRFDFLAHDQFVAGSSQIMALNARLDTVVLQQYRDPTALVAEQTARQLGTLIEELALPRYLPPGAAEDLEPIWQRLQTLVAQKRQLVGVWTEHNHAYFQALALAADPSAPVAGLELAVANRESSLSALLASDLANLSQDLLNRYVVHCQAVLARDREWAVGLFIAFMLTASGLSLYAIYLIRRADGAIQAADARYRNLLLNAVEGIFQTSPEGQFLDVNPAPASILKCDSPQALIKAYDNLENQLYVEPDRRELLRSLLAKNSVVNHFESQVFCKDGAII